MWRTPGDARRPPRRRAQPRARAHVSGGSSSAIETSCDDTCAAVVGRRRGDPLERHLLAGDPRPLRRRRARGRRAPAPGARQRRSSTTRCARRTSTLDDIGRIAVTQGPGLVGALLIGIATRQGPRRRARPAAVRRRPPPGPRLGELPGARAVRAAVPVPDRQRRPHVPRARRRPHRLRRCWARRSTTPPARRSTRARACSACRSPAVRRSSASPPRATRARSTSRSPRASPAWTSRSRG